MRADMCAPAADPDIASADFVVVFGGDGTLLGAARLVAPFGTPLLGVHLGHFGFISEVAPQDLFRAVDDVLAGRAQVEERIMLQGQIRSETAGERSLLAVNDVVLASGAVRMIHVRTSIGGEEIATYAADGVIVATPTGSTGYSLSAGGPLVHPSAPVLILTPICPHTLNARTMIVPATETIELRIESPTRDSGVVSVDGQIEIPLQPGEMVSVSSAPHCVRLLMTSGPNFYQKIRSRWHYGERETA
jgi:NAD+ kinase